MRAPQKPKTLHEKKRYGHHQKRSKVFSNTYLPYLPMTIILFISVLMSGYMPQRGTLAYATSVSQDTLLSATNVERSKRSAGALSINSKLTAAAQTKANDMATRDYWSHNTPDGLEPWTFVKDAGYQYQKAGENLAYGFVSSDETITGWMNSPKHRDNMLDKDFTEVGFGFANSSNYNSSGKETVIVAMYAQPFALGAATAKPSESTPTTEFVTANSKPVSRIAAITNGKSPWLFVAISFITGLLTALLLVRHSIRIRRLVKDSKKFVTHHPLIDSTIIALIVLGITLTRVVGFIH